jgi:heat shock protein HslJ
LFVVWSAVNRTSRSNKIIGPKERITPYAALQAITTGSAYMYREEDLKGTLEEGKLADFVILNQNPVKVDPTAIKDVQVLETIKEGKTIYSKYTVPSSVPAGEWLLESLNGEALPAGIKTPTLSVKEDGSLAGFGGVNRFFGKVATDDKKLFGPIGSTMMAGPPEAMKVESQLFQAFEKATRATSADGKLKLLDSADQVLAEFVSQ